MTDAIQELYDERVAIMVHDGKISEDEAIKAAYFEIKRLHAVKVMPEKATTELKRVMERRLGGLTNGEAIHRN